MDDEKRMFFGAEVFAPWPHLPPGRMIAETERHLTLAFLGNTSFAAIEQLLSQFPQPSFAVGPVGWCDRLFLFPKNIPKSPPIISNGCMATSPRCTLSCSNGYPLRIKGHFFPMSPSRAAPLIGKSGERPLKSSRSLSARSIYMKAEGISLMSRCGPTRFCFLLKSSNIRPTSPS